MRPGRHFRPSPARRGAAPLRLDDGSGTRHALDDIILTSRRAPARLAGRAVSRVPVAPLLQDYVSGVACEIHASHHRAHHQ